MTFVRRPSRVAEIALRIEEIERAEQRARRRTGQKPRCQLHLLAERARDERADGRAEIDAHVEDRETRVASRAGLAFVERADHRRNVRLQQPDAEHHDEEAGVEHRRRRGDGQDEVAGRDEQAAGEDGLALAYQPVGDPAARDREQVGAAREQRVHRAGRRAVDAEARIRRHERRREEQHEHRAHAVVREALEELDHEAGDQPARMSEKLFAGSAGDTGAAVGSFISLCPEFLWALLRRDGAESDPDARGPARQEWRGTMRSRGGISACFTGRLGSARSSARFGFFLLGARPPLRAASSA